MFLKGTFSGAAPAFLTGTAAFLTVAAVFPTVAAVFSTVAVVFLLVAAVFLVGVLVFLTPAAAGFFTIAQDSPVPRNTARVRSIHQVYYIQKEGVARGTREAEEEGFILETFQHPTTATMLCYFAIRSPWNHKANLTAGRPEQSGPSVQLHH
jgi:hypothetical protein